MRFTTFDDAYNTSTSFLGLVHKIPNHESERSACHSVHIRGVEVLCCFAILFLTYVGGHHGHLRDELIPIPLSCFVRRQRALTSSSFLAVVFVMSSFSSTALLLGFRVLLRSWLPSTCISIFHTTSLHVTGYYPIV